jgi:hypothetical protein
MLSGKVSKFSITFIFCAFPDSALYLISRILRDRCQSESKICIQGSSTHAVCSNAHNVFSVYRI